MISPESDPIPSPNATPIIPVKFKIIFQQTAELGDHPAPISIPTYPI